MHTATLVLFVGAGTFMLCPSQTIGIWNTMLQYMLDKVDRAIEREIVRIGKKNG